MCSFGSCQTRFEFLSQFRKIRNAFECFVTQVQTRAKNQMRLAYEDLYCTNTLSVQFFRNYVIIPASCLFFNSCTFFMSIRMSYLLLGGRGFQPVVGKGGSALRFTGVVSGGLPEWGHLGNLGLGLGCSGPFGSPMGFVRCFVSW